MSEMVNTGAWSMLRRVQWSGLAVPILVVLILGMMILPLPPILLDLLFTFNIAASILVLLAAVYTVKSLEFAAFPIVLLLTTLLRLSLNVASARIVLLNGHTGPGAAGKVIESFGQVLVGGNFAVGLVVFVILVVINFVVITKGAGRIAEVSARFTLDAMPGKQMAIDADLNAGLIGEAEARRRRTEIAQQSEFYGAMDGASKFVRGDAVAGILILVVNIVGGFAIGVLQHNLPASVALNYYVLLAIGDGLVAQVPALVISMAAGLIVSRVGEETSMGDQLAAQLFARPQTFTIAAGVLCILGLIPGMPHFVFLLFAAACGYCGHWLRRRALEKDKVPEAKPVAAALDPANEATWDDLVPVDVLAMEVGYRLIPLVDRNQDGELLKRIKGIRKKFAQEIGFLPPSVHIRDNLDLKPNAYRILINGVVAGEGEAVAGMFLAIDPGGATQKLPGAPTKDPAFGLPATWIESGFRAQAQVAGYTVVDAGTVAATHLNTLMQRNASTLLGRQETQQLVDHFGKYAGKLLEEVVPKLVTLAGLQQVLRFLLDEGVAIRDLRTIIESIAEHAPRTQDPAELCAKVRCALGASIVQNLFGGVAELPVMVLEPDLEKIVQQAMGGGALGLEPGLADTLMRDTQNAARRHEAVGETPVLLAPDSLRWPLARLLRRALPNLRVLAHGEIPDNRSIRVTQVVGAPA